MLNKRWTLLLIGLAFLVQSMDRAVSQESSPLPKIDKTIPGLDLMPPGSKLKNVSMPRYKGRELNLLVTSDLMTVASAQEIVGENVLVYLYAPGKVKTTTMSMLDASYFFDVGILISRGETRIYDSRVDAVGFGMTYDTTLKKVFMTGPVETRIRFPKPNKKDTEL